MRDDKNTLREILSEMKAIYREGNMEARKALIVGLMVGLLPLILAAIYIFGIWAFQFPSSRGFQMFPDYQNWLKWFSEPFGLIYLATQLGKVYRPIIKRFFPNADWKGKNPFE